MYRQTDQLCEYSALQQLNMTPARKQEIVTDGIEQLGAGADACVGALVGGCSGDGIGAPLEFLPVTSTPYPTTIESARALAEQGERPFLGGFLGKDGQLVYFAEENRFELRRGQWTDDASMSLCMADSLLLHNKYCGGDIRVRFFNWWMHGYNNSFRFDKRRQYRTSVGLGGNISKSIDNLLDFIGKPLATIPPRFESSGEDAGNGSIMRLAPVPMRYWHSQQEAMKYGAESSYTTHPGPDAAACCRFMSFVISECIKGAHDLNRPLSSTGSMAQFLDAIIPKYLAATEPLRDTTGDTGEQKLRALLLSAPPSATELCWNWKVAGPLPLEETIIRRGRRYNGYPVSAGYFGSYCMDGLAMALYGLRNSTTFSGAVLNIVNMLGDCDTTGAIGAQMAGAFYGYSSMKGDELGKAMVESFSQWDAEWDIRLKGLMLFYAGCPESEKQQASGTERSSPSSPSHCASEAF